MFHKKHKLKIFNFVEKSSSVLKIFTVLYFNNLMIYQICDVMMSISTYDSVDFKITFSTRTDKVTKFVQLIDISMGNDFHESFEQFGKLGLHSRSISI